MKTLLARMVRALEGFATRANGRLSRPRLFAAVAVGYAFFVVTYVPINRASIGRAAHVLYLPGEQHLPFVPAWEYFYILTYLLPWLLPLRLAEARRFAQTTLAFLVILGVAYLTYAVFPVYLERPHLEVDSLATWLIAFEYHDPSYNHLPSLHVALSWLIYLACRRPGRWRAPFFLLMLAISLSTLFIKQHYLADVVYGIVLAIAAFALAGALLQRVPRPGEQPA
jgi:membrane-associated phospholipid phosphatase